MKSRIVRVLAAAMLSVIVVGGQVSAADEVTATLDGAPISLERASELSCHDFEYPILRCFKSAKAMSLAIEATRLDRVFATSALDVGDVGWVTVYEHASYNGNAMALSVDQPWLGSIGWNDRISSFKSHGAAGTFRQNSPSGGFVFFFGPLSAITYVGDYYNDRFSALYIN